MTANEMTIEGDAVQFDKWWMPATETHLIENMRRANVRVDGRLAYQWKKYDAALRLVKCWDTCIDAGSHVGLFSYWVTRRFQRVHAFEPIPLHRELFARNVDMGNVTLHAMALGEHDGVTDMQVPLETTGNAHVAVKGMHPGTREVQHPERSYTVKDVPMRRLDGMGIQGVGLFKVDCEGVERAVMAGAEKTIRRDKPIILLEQKKNESAYGDQPNAALKLLQSWGAKIDREISGDYLLRWDGCGCGDRREAIKRAVGMAP